MAEILRDFPSYTWVCKLNEKRKFSGSLGTSPTKGQFSVHIFNYKLWKKEVTDEEEQKHKFLCVSCYIQPPANSGQEAFGQEEKEYPFSQDAIGEAKNWLLERIEQYSDIIGKE